MGNATACSTHCSQFTLVADTDASDWNNDGALDYQYAVCECTNCKRKTLCLRSRVLSFDGQITDWKPYDKQKCQHTLFKADSNSLEYHSANNIRNKHNRVAHMILAPLFPTNKFVTALAKCIRCGEDFIVKAHYRKVIKNNEEITIIDSEWKKRKTQ